MNQSKPVPPTGDVGGQGKTKIEQSRFMKFLSAHKLTAFETKKEKAKREKLKLKQAALQAASEQQQASAVGVQVNGNTAHVSSSKLHELLNNTQQPSSGPIPATGGNTQKTPASTAAAPAPHPPTRSRSSSTAAEGRASLSTSVVESAVSMNRARNMSSHIFDAEELPIQSPPPAAASVPAFPPLSPRRFPPTQLPAVHPPTPRQHQMTSPLSPRHFMSYNGPPFLHMQIPPAAYAQMLHTQQQQLSARMRPAEQQQIPAGYHYHHPSLYQQQLSMYNPYYAQQQQQQQSQPSLNTLHRQTPSGNLLPLLQPQLVSPRFDTNNRQLYTATSGTFLPTAATDAQQQQQQPTTTTTSSAYANTLGANASAANTVLPTPTGTAPTVGEFSEIRLHNQRSSVFAAAASTAAAPSQSTVDADDLLRKQRLRQETQRGLLQQIQEKKAKAAQEKQRLAREEQLEEERIQREIVQLRSGTTGTTIGNMQQQLQHQLSQTSSSSSSSVASIAAEDVSLLQKLQADAEKVKSHKLHQHHRNGPPIQEEEKHEQEEKTKDRRRRGAEERREDYDEQKDKEYGEDDDVVDDGYEDDPAYNSYPEHDGYTHSRNKQSQKHKTHSYYAEDDRTQMQSSSSWSSSPLEERAERQQQRHAMSNKRQTNNNTRNGALQQQHNMLDEYEQDNTMPARSVSKKPTQLQRTADLTMQQQQQRGVGARRRVAAVPLPNTKAYQQQQAAIRLMSGKSSIRHLKHNNTQQPPPLQATQQATTHTHSNSKRYLPKGGPLLPSLPTGVLVDRGYAGSQYDGHPTLSARTLVDQLEGTSEFLLPQELDLPSFRK